MRAFCSRSSNPDRSPERASTSLAACTSPVIAFCYRAKSSSDLLSICSIGTPDADSTFQSSVSGVRLKISFISERASLFRRRDSPEALPPLLVISRSSLGVRSLFLIKFCSFNAHHHWKNWNKKSTRNFSDAGRCLTDFSVLMDG